MAANSGRQHGTRMSALWGTGGKRGDGSRSSALWGKGGRTLVVLTMTAFAALLAPWGAIGSPGGTPHDLKGSGAGNVYVTDSLLSQAQSNPQSTFNVIVQGDGSAGSDAVAQQVAQTAAQASPQLAAAGKHANDALAKANKDVANATARVTKAKGPGAAKARQQLAVAQAELAQAQSQVADAQSSLNAQSQNILHQDVNNQFSTITGVAATLTGDQLASLVQNGNGLLSITPNTPVVATGREPQLGPHALGKTGGWWSAQLWPYESKTNGGWKQDKGPGFNPNTIPSIAIVDSGIQSDRSDFGGRVVASVNLSTLPGNTDGGDQRGHGTFVAGIAADGLPGITGTNPVANLVDVKVLDSTGMGLTSDVINACQWILDNRAKYDIRVVNLSLHSSITAPFYLDPLDRAVEQLWFNGIVVVAAAGNYGNPDGPSGVLYSPGDDPFVVTVGAADINGSTEPSKATVAPWSAWGYTIDGFAKPELSAPGRYLIGPVPTDSTLVSELPDNVIAPGYIELSGTSFAAPIVSGAAATLLDQHENWTPDQVKGALMLRATGLTGLNGAGGVGTIQVGPMFGPGANNPPNPNLALEAFVKKSSSNGTNTVSFDSASWNSAVQQNASWNSASWNSASWNSASWNSASWNSASWNSASWNSASWNSASWNSVSWNSASWNSAAVEDAAEGDATNPSALAISPADIMALLNDPDVDPSTLPMDLLPATPASAPAPTTTTSTTSAPAPATSAGSGATTGATTTAATTATASATAADAAPSAATSTTTGTTSPVTSTSSTAPPPPGTH